MFSSRNTNMFSARRNVLFSLPLTMIAVLMLWVITISTASTTKITTRNNNHFIKMDSNVNTKLINLNRSLKIFGRDYQRFTVIHSSARGLTGRPSCCFFYENCKDSKAIAVIISCLETQFGDILNQ